MRKLTLRIEGKEAASQRPQNGRRRFIIYCDGLCEPNPKGIGCWAFLVLCPKSHLIHQEYGNIGNGEGVTNNVAEFQAVLKALDWLISVQDDYEVEIFTDSQLVVNLANGKWTSKKPHLKLLAARAYELLHLTNATLRWIPRKQNEQADSLTRVAYREALAEKGATV